MVLQSAAATKKIQSLEKQIKMKREKECCKQQWGIDLSEQKVFSLAKFWGQNLLIASSQYSISSAIQSKYLEVNRMHYPHMLMN